MQSFVHFLAEYKMLTVFIKCMEKIVQKFTKNFRVICLYFIV